MDEYKVVPCEGENRERCICQADPLPRDAAIAFAGAGIQLVILPHSAAEGRIMVLDPDEHGIIKVGWISSVADEQWEGYGPILDPKYYFYELVPEERYATR